MAELSRTRRTTERRGSLPDTRRQGIFWILTVPVISDVEDGALGLTGSQIIMSMLNLGKVEPPLVWIKGQQECGEETGYRHYQVVVAFNKKVSLTGVKSVFGSNCHGELSRSEAAVAYCCKEDTRVGDPFEFGVKPIRRNSAVDWESVWSAAKSGDIEDVPASIRVQNYHALRTIRSDYAVCPALERTVHVFWGSTGTGKSRRAWDEAGIGGYPKDPKSKFWDGYRGQKNVVIDEFRGTIDVAHILRWFDRYPVFVELKGSSRPLLATSIWITSNLDPRLWYPDLDTETYAALLRRLTITHFD